MTKLEQLTSEKIPLKVKEATEAPISETELWTPLKQVLRRRWNMTRIL
jgi:hypothetical protein